MGDKFASFDSWGQDVLADLEARRKIVRGRAVVALLASSVALAAFGTVEALSAGRNKQVSSHQRKKAVAVKHHKVAATHRKSARNHKAKAKNHKAKVEVAHRRHLIVQPSTGEAPGEPLPPDLAKAKQAIELVRRGKGKDAVALAASIGDPAAAKLVEWVRLRHADGEAGFDRTVAFMRANPDWPSMALLRRRAEPRLWQERRDAATVRRFIGDKPASAIGRLALARVEMGEGDRAEAESEVRAVWQSGAVVGRPGSRSARRVPRRADPRRPRGAHGPAHRRQGFRRGDARRKAPRRRSGRDRQGVHRRPGEIPPRAARCSMRSPPTPARIWATGCAACTGCCATTRRARIFAAASRRPKGTSRPRSSLRSPRRRRICGARTPTNGGASVACSPASCSTSAMRRPPIEVVRAAALPANPYYRAEFHFMAGWIALRFLADPATALKHFAHIDDGRSDPIVLARAAYWRGRAAEAAGQLDEMQAQYEAAARYPTAYYGQLARARLGLRRRRGGASAAEPADGDANEPLHAATILYGIGEGDLAMAFLTDLAEESSDPAVIAGLGRLTRRYNDARAMLLVGKTALARGLPMDQYAFPDIGVPSYSPVGSPIDRCLVYSIVRTESAFDQRDTSPAKAVGLMQVTPEAGRDTAKRFGVAYDWKRLVSDPVYNTQMGAGELAALLKDYRGSYIMTFAGYNAGRGRVQQWVAQHGDPRDPKVDAVDWVERIPFSETRNYVQRVMENLQVYRAPLRRHHRDDRAQPASRRDRRGAPAAHHG